MSIDTGGPAFPVPESMNIHLPQGMNLRDWFASRYQPDSVELSMERAILVMGSEIPKDPSEQIDWGLGLQAKLAYRHADAMIKARDKS